MRIRRRFQSTHPRGVRPVVVDAQRDGRPVSIHAPAWGATFALTRKTPAASVFQSTHPRGVRRRSSPSSSRPDPCFNPRTRVGCDEYPFAIEVTLQKFQSTHPRGVRRIRQVISVSASICFNPRTRVGCDGQQPRPSDRQTAVSIHAPAWGATRPAGDSPGRIHVSIHAPAWGATAVVLVVLIVLSSSFNPRTRVGCDCRKSSIARKS